MIKNSNITVFLFLMSLLCSCGEKEQDPAAEGPKTYAVSFKASSGAAMHWEIGAELYFADDVSAKAGTKVTATRSLMSSDGKTLSAAFRSISEGAGTVYAICADEAWVRNWKSAFRFPYDGSYAFSAAAAGAAKVSDTRMQLYPLMGVVSFNLTSSEVRSVVVRAPSAVFPEEMTCDFKNVKAEIISKKSSAVITVAGVGTYYFPIVPGSMLAGCTADLCSGTGEVLSSVPLESSLQADAGAVISVGTIDSGIGPGTSQPGIPSAEQMQSAIRNMGVGLSLGGMDEFPRDGVVTDRNDPFTFENMWGGEITKLTTKSMATAGFKCVRVPVTWIPHMDDYMSEIDDVWLDRIEEIVNLVLNDGMYCIINVHHDTGTKSDKGAWLYADWANYTTISAGLKNVWKQIAERFKDYDHKLLFEGYNEILDENKKWFAPTTSDGYKAANALNQDFVDVVRQTGGLNSTRNLIVTTYSASTWEEALKGFVMPTDITPGHLAVQVHSYLPTAFVTAFDNWRAEFYDSDIPEIHAMFDLLKKHLLDKDYPCVLGEFGAYNRNNDQARGRHAAVYTRKALELGIAPICWHGPMAVWDRKIGNWTYPALKDSLIKAYNDHVEKLR